MAAPSLTYTLSNGTTADASQVMQNFNDLLNGYTDGTKDLTCNKITLTTTINKLTITAPASSATLTIADGKTLTCSNTLTFTGTDSSTVACGAGGTVAYTSNKLSAFAATTSTELLGVISDETGSGSLVFANTPTLVTPVLGVASGTSLSVNNGSTDGGAVYFDGGTTKYIKSLADGTALDIVGFNSFRVSGTGTSNPCVFWSQTASASSQVVSVCKSNNTTSEYYLRFFKAMSAIDGTGATAVGRLEDLLDTFTLTSESDERLKTAIVPTSETVLDRLKQVEIVDFEFLSRPGVVVKMGQIAQRTNRLFPEMVSKPDDGIQPLSSESADSWAISSSWHNILIKAIQELTAKVEALEAAA